MSLERQRHIAFVALGFLHMRDIEIDPVEAVRRKLAHMGFDFPPKHRSAITVTSAGGPGGRLRQIDIRFADGVLSVTPKVYKITFFKGGWDVATKAE